MRFNQFWPETLSILRHGQSAGNVARDLAESKLSEVIEIDFRDVDVPLSELGHRQARAIGEWFAQQPKEKRPTIILSSPYKRALQTADEVSKLIGVEVLFDERLREREFGALDRLTGRGIRAKFPMEAELRSRLGKFYYRPPGGESWTDVLLRLRSVLDSLARDYADQRVLIVCHSVVILCLRYLFETMTEEQILQIERENDIANCSLTSYRFEGKKGTAGLPVLETFNFVAPLKESHERVTTEPDRQ
jgi:broad specificity phosphatase PhoE